MCVGAILFVHSFPWVFVFGQSLAVKATTATTTALTHNTHAHT